MHHMKMIDGTPADPAYVRRIEQVVGDAAVIESQICIDEREAYAEEQLLADADESDAPRY